MTPDINSQSTFSFMSVEALQITNCQWGQDVSYVDLTVNNFGTESATLDKLRVNGDLVNDMSLLSGSANLDGGENTVFIKKTFLYVVGFLSDSVCCNI